jgi:thiol-disulfide isomerase/thioredoxin
MRRSQFLAVLVLLVALGGLLIGRFGGDGSGGDDDTDPAGAEADPARPIRGGERAESGAIAPDPAQRGPEPADVVEVEEPPPILDPKPELTGLDGWLQSDATDLSSFDGQVRIVQFWTFGCHNCKATLPHLQGLYAEHRDDGLEIIGVHAPEFAHEAEIDSIALAAIDLGVTWPIALDTDKVNFRAWQGARRFWPRTYVLDQNGDVRFDHIGEGNYDGLAATVEYLLVNGP